MSIRRLADEQVAAGLGIIGSVLERILATLLERFNNIPKRDLARRHVQTQLVGGFLPDPTNTVLLPYMNDENSDTYVPGTKPESYENAERFKGIWHADGCPKYGWQVSRIFHKPCTLQHLDVYLLADSDYVNAFEYNSSPPPGKSNGDPIDDINVIVTVDDPWRPEDEESNSIELARHQWEVNGELMYGATPAGHTDMTPTHPGGTVGGLFIRMQDLNIPIRQGARVRATLCIPKWTSAYTPWGANPWSTCIPQMVQTVLEELEEE